MTKNSADEKIILKTIEFNNKRQETMYKSVIYIENYIDVTASEYIRLNETMKIYVEIAKAKGLNVS